MPSIFRSFNPKDRSVELKDWKSKRSGYELLTREYVEELARYVARRGCVHMHAPFRILELGAGSGLLTFSLVQELQKLDPIASELFCFRAVDNGSWGISDRFGTVENLDYELALQKYQPHFVIVSWMPQSIDFTCSIRHTPSVEEYILIGEPLSTGSVATWDDARIQGDNFEAFELKKLTTMQIDVRWAWWPKPRWRHLPRWERRKSETLSFRRVCA